jgi:hypothetical protein
MTDSTGAPAEHPSPPPPVRGLAVYDEVAEEFGTVADVWPTGLVFLRPLGGGLEWETRREAIRPALASELLAKRVRALRAMRGTL